MVCKCDVEEAMRSLGRIGGMLVGCILVASAIMMARGKRVEIRQSPCAVQSDAGKQYNIRIRATERLLFDNGFGTGR